MDQLVLLLSYPLVVHPVEVSLLTKLVPCCRRLHKRARHELLGAEASVQCTQQQSF